MAREEGSRGHARMIDVPGQKRDKVSALPDAGRPRRRAAGSNQCAMQ
jgi:hypothetical protein